MIWVFKRSAVAVQELKKKAAFSIEDEVIDGVSEALSAECVESVEECEGS